MNYRVIVLPEAEADLERIYRRIVEQSPQGARRWYESFLGSIQSLRDNPFRHGLAPENEFVEPEIRQALFKTRQGRPYRALFRVLGTEVQILHIRGPGQDLLKPEELP